ncbi:MAG: hypothetical protein JNL19_12355 [Burkholderiales bacterium]|nr:hypothetical protein [Burkholderiales bacterium]
MERRQFLGTSIATAAALAMPRSVLAQSANRISVADSPLANALNVYYDSLVKICQPQGLANDQKLLLCNTITPFPIAEDTPYYSQGVFRNYVDRVFAGEPSNAVGPASRAERFSFLYSDLVGIANSKIEQSHPEVAVALRKKRDELTVQRKELVQFLGDVRKQWSQQPEAALPPTDARYMLGYITFLNNIQYESQLQTYRDPVSDTLSEMNAIRRGVYKPWEQAVLDAFEALSEDSSESRPLQPTFERSWAAAGRPPLTDLDFSTPIFRSPTLFDVTPGIYPTSDLSAFLRNQGTRRIDISSSSQYQHTHDSAWGASGSASYMFFSVGGSGGGSSHFAQDIRKSNALTFEFANMEEVLADRQLWFNPQALIDPNVRKLIGTLPAYNRLQYVSVSAIIARGLTLTVSFSSSVATQSWTQQSIAASGGISIFGFGFGGGGSSSQSDSTVTVSADGSSVTFKDGPKVARVLGYRIEPFIKPMQDTSKKPLTSLDPVKSGAMSYINFQQRRFVK